MDALHEDVVVFGEAYEPLLRGLPALAVFWLVFYWMYRRGIFVKL